MDGFIVDLDKVLDDFEESEDAVAVVSSQHSLKEEPAPPSYHAVTQESPATFSPPTALIECPKMYGKEDITSGIPDAGASNLHDIPGSGVFDLPYGPNLDQNVHRLEQMGIAECGTQNLYKPNGDEGHFIPDEAQDVTDGPYGYDPDIFNTQVIALNEPYSNEHLFEPPDNEELLQAASELQAHIGGKEDRPSFMSSSPPSLSSYRHADIMPSSCSTDSSQASNENQSDSGVSSEQGETGITNTYTNTSPVHRAGPVDASNVLHSLEEIAQSSYTVPSTVSENTYQIRTELVANENKADSFVGELQDNYGAQSLTLDGSGDTDKVLSQLLPSNTAEKGSDLNHDNLIVSHSQNKSINDPCLGNEITHDPDMDVPSNGAFLSEQLNQTNADVPIENCDEVNFCSEEHPILQPTHGKVPPLSNDYGTDVGNDCEGAPMAAPCSLSAHKEAGSTEPCQERALSDVSSAQLPQADVVENSSDAAPWAEGKPVQVQSEQRDVGNGHEEVIIETCDKSNEQSVVLEKQSGSCLSKENEPQTSEVCDVIDLGNVDELASSEAVLTEEDYAAAMAQAECELAALEQEITRLKDEGVVACPQSDSQKTESSPSCEKSMDFGGITGDTIVSADSANSPTVSTQTVSAPSQISQVSDMASPASWLTSPTSPEAPADELIKRRDSGESVERFLAPSVMSPGIATPMDDPGFTKVPGYLPALDSTTEEDEALVMKGNASGLSSSDSFTDVKPKESTPERSRKNRPNSLLGLSKPDAPAARVLQEDKSSAQSLDVDSINPLYHASLSSQSEILKQDADTLDGGMTFPQENDGSAGGINSGLSTACDDVFSPVSGITTIESQGILRSKNVPPQGSLGIESRSADPPTSLSLPNSNIQHPQRPASWPVRDTPQESQKQRRPNSLNIPSRGGSVSPSQSSSLVAPVVPVVSGTPAGTGEVTSGREPMFLGVESAMETTETETAVEAAVPGPDVSASGTSPDSLITVPSMTSPGRTPGTALPPQSSSNPSLSITDLGKIAPTWVPDAEAPNCMQCDVKFTFTKRRHHCRACGKVFCSSCCSLKSKLTYMDSKEARVCSKCYQDLIRAVVFERMTSEEGAAGGSNTSPSPNPNNPSEYCSTIPPLQQAQANLNAPPPSVMVPVGVLRKEGSLKRESKQVMFSDGIRPGGDLTELDGSGNVPYPPPQRSGRRARKVERSSDTQSLKSKVKSVKPTQVPIVTTCYVPQTGLPPVFKGVGSRGEFTMDQTPDVEAVMARVTAGDAPVQFVVNKNLLVLVKLVMMDCCVHRKCWCFTSKGMGTVGQDEIVILLECLPNEACLPVDIFQHFHNVYEDASKGEPVSNMDHSIFTQGFLDSRDHGGFLYLRPTFQCLNKLIIPDAPYVFGVLLQKWETPWAKVFPVRLLLRLGAEFRYYPCPLVSVRHRKPVFGEIGHTIMNLLVDFRNYQYMIPHVRGFTIYMKEKKTYLNLPRNRYDDVTRALGSSTEQVLALAANFSKEADSYLVCIQNDDGNYQTQAINIHNKPREVTGASFVVFNANLKPSSGMQAKSSIVEDGLMVQILPETMLQLRGALRDMRDYCVEYGGVQPGEPQESVVIQWVDNDKDFNVGVVSPIDQFPMDGVTDVHIQNAVDYVGEAGKAIRWTQVFFLQSHAENSRIEPVDLSRLAETLSTALSVALTPKLDKLAEAGLLRIGLRARIDNENVGYEVGSNGEKLPDFYMNDLDNELIPVIHNAAAHNRDGSVILELIFHVINV